MRQFCEEDYTLFSRFESIRKNPTDVRHFAYFDRLGNYPSGQIATLTARNSTTGDQITRYVYGTPKSWLAPLIHRNDMLAAEIYPDSTNFEDANGILQNGAGGVVDRVEFQYNPKMAGTMSQHRIVFHQENGQEQTLTIPTGMQLSEAASQAGFDLRTHCGGAGTCGKCQVIVNRQKILACQTTVKSDLDVLVPDASLRRGEENIVVQAIANVSIRMTDYATAILEPRYRIALDIGTTTLAAELHDFANILPMQTVARANPQRKFGDDVIARIQRVMEEPAMLTAMQQLIVGTINEMIAELTEKMGIVPQDVSVVVASGNTVMQSLLFGIDPSSLGTSPFHAPVQNFPAIRGSEIGLTISAEGTIEALPIFGGFVGGDIVAGVLVLPPLQSSTVPRFLLDIGTNGEIVLAHLGELFTAATAAGPAFEGAKIEHGTLAVPGAIDHVEVKSGKIVVSTIGNRPPVGICGSGLIDAVAVLLEQGIIQPNGRFAEKKSQFELVPAAESGIGEAIVLTQRDIRELQLAAGAIRAGITLLLQENDVLPEEIEAFYVSGGFGQSIRLSAARQIGLLPPIPSERFVFCGNTSLAGARAMLLNPDSNEIVRRIVEQSHHCELASLPQFQEVFAGAMQLGWKR